MIRFSLSLGLIGVAGALVATLQAFSLAAGDGLRLTFVVFLVLLQGLASLETSDFVRRLDASPRLRSICALLALVPGISLVLPALIWWAWTSPRS